MRPHVTYLFLILASLCCLCLQAQIPTNGLIVSYPLDGDAHDESGNGLNGIPNGASLAKDRCNKDTSAFFFDGNYDHIYIGDINHLDGSRALSISAWIFTNGITDQHTGTIVSKYNADGDSERVFIFDLYPDNILRFCIYGADGNADYEWLRTSNPIPVSQWNHVVVIWNGLSHNIDFYVNGVEVDSYYGKLGNNPSLIYDKTSPLMIGGVEFGYTSPDYMFNGSIDEVRIYDRVLTPEEVQSLYYFDCIFSGIDGENQVCQGQQNVEYSVVPVGNSTYIWNYSGSGVTISGTGETVSLDFNSQSTSGILSVTIDRQDIVTQVSMPVIVDALPGDAGEIAGEQVVCNDQGLKYEIPPVPGATNYIWEYSGTGVTIAGNSNSAIIFFERNATKGSLTVYGVNSCGMGMASPDFIISVDSCKDPAVNIIIPNAFSPNGDGINDYFEIDGISENTGLTIFSRNGEVLYTSDNYLNDWGGNDLNGKHLETGTYWYVVRIHGIQTDLKGFVYLKR